MSDRLRRGSRRRFVQWGAVTAATLGIGTTGNAAAQADGDDSDDSDEIEDDDEQFRDAIATRGTYFSGAVFRVVSPPLRDAPGRETPDVVRDHEVRVFELFNTNEEGFLFVPPETRIEEGEQYVFDDQLYSSTVNEPVTDELVRVQYRPLTGTDLPFDLEGTGGFETLEGGGEAAVRPDDFFGGALFEITSGPQGWVPEDAAQSGLFTDYNTVHAEYLGTNDRFLLFAQEGATTETDQLYVLRDEAELFDPAGNLVAAEFDPIDEDSLTIDHDFLR